MIGVLPDLLWSATKTPFLGWLPLPMDFSTH